MSADPPSLDLKLLAANRVLEILEPAALQELVGLGKVVHFEAGAVIFDKGSPGDCLYVLLGGRVGIKTMSPDGQEIFLNILEAGDILGEIAMLDGHKRTAGASVMQAADLLSIDRTEFMPFLERHPKLCIRLMGLLCQRLRWTSEIIESTIFLDIPRRLAKRLLSLIDEYGRPDDGAVKLDIKLYQEDLADMLGSTRESVSKAVGTLESQGAITYKRGAITILDPSILKTLVEGSG